MGEVIQSALDFLVGMIVAYVYGLVSHIQSLGEEATHFAYGLAGFSTVLLSLSTKFFVDFCKRLPLIDWRFKVVGSWIEGVDHYRGKQIAISHLRYNREKGQFSIEGRTYTTDSPPNLFAEWHSMSVSFSDEGELYYIYNLTNLLDGGPPNVIGLAHMSFHPQSPMFIEGDGWFLDHTVEPKRIMYDFERIDKKLCMRIIGKPKIADRKQRESFLAAYILERQSFNAAIKQPQNGGVHVLRPGNERNSR